MIPFTFRLRRFAAVVVTVLSTVVLAVPPIHAAGAGGYRASGSSELQEASKAIKKERYQEAIDILKGMHEENSDDADLLNLLGYSHRKLGHYEIALKFYQQALDIKPKHKGANEYLGELYLETNQLQKAEEQLAVLDDACIFKCKEYKELQAAINKYKKQHGLSSDQ